MFDIDAQREQELLTPLALQEQQKDKSMAPGTARGAYFQQARMMNDPALAEANPGAAAETAMDIPNLLAMQEAARNQGKNAHLQAKRGEFERQVSIKLSQNDKVKAAVQKMSDKATSYMMKTRGEVAALSMLGADSTKPGTPAYGGMVGNDPNTVKDVLSRTGGGTEGGNIREQMLALQNFQNVLGEDLTQTKKDKDGNPVGIGLEKMKSAMNVPVDESVAMDQGQKRDEFGPDDLKRLEDRREAIKTEQTKKDPANTAVTTKALWSPTGEEKKGDHKAYGAAKSQDMDTKLPALPAAAATAAVPGLAAKLTPNNSKDGQLLAAELSPLARSDKTVESVEAEGLKLSSREKKMAEKLNHDGGATEVPWIEGQKANIIDTESKFIKQANDESMPLKAGISGTTFRMMELASTLGLDGEDLELVKSACMSSLISVEAHSLHEIATAAGGFTEGGYDSKDAYGAGNIKPLKEEDLVECASKVGCSLNFIRTGTPGGMPGDIAPAGATVATSGAGGGGAAAAGPPAAPPSAPPGVGGGPPPPPKTGAA